MGHLFFVFAEKTLSDFVNASVFDSFEHCKPSMKEFNKIRQSIRIQGRGISKRKPINVISYLGQVVPVGKMSSISIGSW